MPEDALTAEPVSNRGDRPADAPWPWWLHPSARPVTTDARGHADPPRPDRPAWIEPSACRETNPRSAERMPHKSPVLVPTTRPRETARSPSATTTSSGLRRSGNAVRCMVTHMRYRSRPLPSTPGISMWSTRSSAMSASARSTRPSSQIFCVMRRVSSRDSSLPICPFLHRSLLAHVALHQGTEPGFRPRIGRRRGGPQTG